MRPTSFFKLQYFLILQNCEHYFMCLPYIPLQSYDNIRNNRRNESIYVFCNVGVVRITVTYRIQIRVSLNLLKNSVFSEISRENCCITDFVLKLFFSSVSPRENRVVKFLPSNLAVLLPSSLSFAQGTICYSFFCLFASYHPLNDEPAPFYHNLNSTKTFAQIQRVLVGEKLHNKEHLQAPECI